MADEQGLPAGYRQGVITSITVVLTASLLFFRFVVFEPSSGPWTKWGAACAVLAAISILMQLFTLWRRCSLLTSRYLFTWLRFAGSGPQSYSFYPVWWPTRWLI